LYKNKYNGGLEMNNKLKETIQDISELAIQTGAPLAGSLISNALAGQIIPGAATFILDLKQKRTERMLLTAIDELKKQIVDINNSLKEMKDTQIEFIEETIFPIALDFIEKESQEEKIKYIVNGAINSIKNNITDTDLILSYYDILNELRMIDIRILINLYGESKKMNRLYMEDADRTIKTEYEAAETYIIKKLESLSLISVKKTHEELAGRVVKPKKSATDISRLGIYFVEFFSMYGEE
jgi:hypothetical protein